MGSVKGSIIARPDEGLGISQCGEMGVQVEVPPEGCEKALTYTIVEGKNVHYECLFTMQHVFT